MPVPSNGHELQRLRIQLRSALGEPQHFDANHLVLLVEIQHDARRHLFRFDNWRVVQAQVKSVRFAVNLQFHSLPLIVRSKYTLTTRSGATVVLTTTRSTGSGVPVSCGSGVPAWHPLGRAVSTPARATRAPAIPHEYGVPPADRAHGRSIRKAFHC